MAGDFIVNRPSDELQSRERMLLDMTTKPTTPEGDAPSEGLAEVGRLREALLLWSSSSIMTDDGVEKSAKLQGMVYGGDVEKAMTATRDALSRASTPQETPEVEGLVDMLARVAREMDSHSRIGMNDVLRRECIALWQKEISSIEAALRTQEARPDAVAARYDFDGYGYRYIDSGSGSDWRTRHPDAELLYSGHPRTDAAGMQPLGTAPKDGTYFLMVGSNFDGGAAVVQWDAGLECWTLDDGKNPEIALRAEHKLIGWMPLPEAIDQALGEER